MQSSLLYRDQHAIILWLAVCLLLVASMVAVGGYTRLSGAGLSITEWKPIHGAIPPRNEAEWGEEFAAYQQTPQYAQVNRGMTLEEFKVIFWPEYVHRLLGRCIGAVFFLPFLFFALRRSFTAKLGWRLAGIFALGGLQGVVGWIMVKSGLVDNPYVSPLKLALHLMLAFAIAGLIVWAILDIKKPSGGERINTWYLLWFTLLCLQLIMGALVAGSHAGLVYNSWPDMNGSFLPAEALDSAPFMENLALIQFIHRNLAVLLAGGFLFWWYCHYDYVKNKHLGKVAAGVTAIIALQFLLGVLTLVQVVPLSLALAHQVTAFLLFALAIVLMHGLARKGTA